MLTVVPSTHHHLARPLVATPDDIEPLGEIYCRTLFGTNANNLDELTRNRIDIESGVTIASNEDNAALGTLGNRTCRGALDALRQEVVGHWDSMHCAHRHEARHYVKQSLHLASSLCFNLQN